jgi:hypothetical protein
MLELLLFTYRDMFGADFPLADFAGKPEYEVINILYDCVSNALPYDPGRKVEFKITDAPGMP